MRRSGVTRRGRRRRRRSRRRRGKGVSRSGVGVARIDRCDKGLRQIAATAHQTNLIIIINIVFETSTTDIVVIFYYDMTFK